MENYDKYVGMTIDDRYLIQRIIGIGGMAVVFEAEDQLMHRTVALKMLKDEITGDTTSVRRFINESRAVAMLNHPNIVNIYDVSVGDDSKYIVMDHIRGITLKNYMNRKGTLSFRETVNFTEQILRALMHAHEKGIIHRDIKPQNIMLLKNGMIKVADFGIAKLPSAETVTMTDKAIGTVYYISPEQASGKPIDPRSDLYSVGVMMYEMVTGQLPFNADSPVTVAMMQVHDTPTVPRKLNPQIPLGLQQFILKAMEKEPDKRYQSAREMLRQLIQLKNNPDVVFSISGTREEEEEEEDEIFGKKKQKSSMFPIIAGVMTAFLLVGAIAAFYILSRVINYQNENAAQTVEIGSYLGQTCDDAFLSEMPEYFNVVIEYEYDETVEPGVILAQDPPAGESRVVSRDNEQCKITLTVSQGVMSFEMPDFSMMEYRSVVLKLKKMGLENALEYEYHDSVLEDYVIRTEPAAGQTVASGDTITLFISQGQKIKYTTVPDFSGLSEREAMLLLIKSDLSLGKVEVVKSELPVGSVISQSRPENSEAPRHASVDFVVSGGSKYSEPTKEAAN